MAIFNEKTILTIMNLDDEENFESNLKLVKKANELAKEIEGKNISVIIGAKEDEKTLKLISGYSDKLFLYKDEKLNIIDNTIYSEIVKDFINKNKIGFLLMNNDDLGKSIASRVAGYFDSSVLTNCETLNINEKNQFVDFKIIGNKKIEILSKGKLQIATLNKKKNKLNNSFVEKEGSITKEEVKNFLNKSVETILKSYKIEETMSIDKAEVLVVAGKGVRTENDLELIKKLAKALGGEIAFTRPLVQMGWAKHEKQVGISGTKVKPKLIITVGVSGAAQFTDGMKESENIIAINCNKTAPIFEIANCGIVGDLYEVIPSLLSKIN